MRIFLLPLTTRQALVYYQRTALNPGKKPSILDRISRKANDTWAKWEQAEKGWQKKLVVYGNRALQRIPYQEWSLKSFPPTNATLQAELLTDGKKFDVVYPGNVMNREDVPKVLSRLARERKQLHFNRFVGSMVAMPFTIPFAIIPVIPNIPFFYVAYRCWSHWRALRGSDHLDFILDHRLFNLKSSTDMENLYRRFAPGSANSFEFITRSQIEDGTATKEQAILPSGAHNEVAKVLSVPELSGEVERAVWQVERGFAREEEALKEKEKEAARQKETQANAASETVAEKNKDSK